MDGPSSENQTHLDELKAVLHGLKSSRGVHGQLLTGLLMSFVIYSIVFALIYNLFHPLVFEDHDARYRLWTLYCILSIVIVMNLGLVIRLLLRPQTEPPSRLPDSLLLAMNVRLLRLLCLGKKHIWEPQAELLYEGYHIEVYHGNKARLLVGVALSFIVIAAVPLLCFVALATLGLYTETRLALLAASVLFSLNVALAGMLYALRHYWRQRLFPKEDREDGGAEDRLPVGD